MGSFGPRARNGPSSAAAAGVAADAGTVEGARLPFSAKEKGALWIEYTFPWSPSGGRFYGRYQLSYTGDILNGITTVSTEIDDNGDEVQVFSNPIVQPSYTLSDIKLGIEWDTWDLYAYADNVGDKRAILFDQDSAPYGTRTINTPRTYGIGFTMKWGD